MGYPGIEVRRRRKGHWRAVRLLPRSPGPRSPGRTGAVGRAAGGFAPRRAHCRLVVLVEAGGGARLALQLGLL